MRILLYFLLINFSLVRPIYGQNPKETVSYRKICKLIKKNDLNSIKLLVQNGLDLNKRYKRNQTILHLAAYYENYQIVKYLVDSHVDLNAIETFFNYTPLQISTSDVWSNDSISIYLINNGANLDNIGKHGSSALRNTIGFWGKGTNKYLFKLLIEKGADINYQCSECCNRTTFLNCCARADNEMIQLLLNKGVNINQTDCEGINGLMYAIQKRNVEVIKFLIENKIDINYKDNKQKTAYDYALKTKNKEIISLVESAK
jgi:ankyrin repeat protein